MQVQRELGELVGERVHMLSITLDPEVDDSRRLAEYAEAYGAGPGWTFLTGDHGEIELLRHKLGAYDPDPVIDADKTQHAGLVIYGSERLGRWAGVPGMLQPHRIARAVRRTLEAEDRLRAALAEESRVTR